MARLPDLPAALQPRPPVQLRLPSGRSVEIAVGGAEFEPWTGAPLRNTLGPKPVLASRGGPALAELHVQRLFEDAGWRARWVEPWTRPAMAPAFLTEWGEAERDLVSLRGQRNHPPGDPHVERVLDAIAQRNGATFAGVWDVLAWSGKRIVFAELKLIGKDRIRPSQLRWLEAALAVGGEFGLDESSFLIVEWSNSSPWPARPPKPGPSQPRVSRPAVPSRGEPQVRAPRSRRRGAAGAVVSDAESAVGADPAEGVATRFTSRAAPGPLPADRAEFEAHFERFWRSLLDRFRAGEALRFAPRTVGAGVGNRRRVVDMTPSGMQLVEEGPRGSSSKCARGELENDLWKLCQDRAVERDSIRVLRTRHAIRNLVEFKRDLFEQFRSFPTI